MAGRWRNDGGTMSAEYTMAGVCKFCIKVMKYFLFETWFEYSKVPIIRTVCSASLAVHSMYCQTGIHTDTYNRHFRVGMLKVRKLQKEIVVSSISKTITKIGMWVKKSSIQIRVSVRSSFSDNHKLQPWCALPTSSRCRPAITWLCSLHISSDYIFLISFDDSKI